MVDRGGNRREQQTLATGPHGGPRKDTRVLVVVGRWCPNLSRSGAEDKGGSRGWEAEEVMGVCHNQHGHPRGGGLGAGEGGETCCDAARRRGYSNSRLRRNRGNRYHAPVCGGSTKRGKFPFSTLLVKSTRRGKKKRGLQKIAGRRRM